MNNFINLAPMGLSKFKIGVSASQPKPIPPEEVGPVPGLDGVIGYYDTIGLTNEKLSDNPVWIDKSLGKNDLQFKNFAWKLNSGVGLYLWDFNSWSDSSESKPSERTTSKIKLLGSNNEQYFGTVINKGGTNEVIVKTTVKITGLTPDLPPLYFGKFNLGPSYLQELKEGINVIDITIRASDIWYGFGFGKGVPSCNVTIEQIPDYSGAICFDGINDYAVCDTFPILTKEKGYTVMALRSIISKSGGNLATKTYDTGMGAFAIEGYVNRNTYSFGGGASIEILDKPLVYQTSVNYNGSTVINKRNVEDNEGLVIGVNTMYTNLGNFANIAIYALCIIDHDTTAEERELVITKWKQDYPELFFDQAWTVKGKTNNDSDRATIKNLTGNGNNLVLSNFAFAEDSGYGIVPYNFTKWNLSSTGTVTGVSRSGKKLSGTVGQWGKLILTSNVTDQLMDFNIKVTGATSLCPLTCTCLGKTVLLAESDGIYNIKTERPAQLAMYAENKSENNVKITIEQIPDYEGYLVTDGVDDKIQSSGFEMGKDWTIVGDWILLQDSYKAAGVIKSPIFYAYNNVNGMVVYLKSGNIQNTLSEIKSLYAVCSDGRVYDSNWNEHKLVIGEESKSTSSLKVGVSSNEITFTKIAFKNLAIYNHILTKEQCINAYNNLQNS